MTRAFSASAARRLLQLSWPDRLLFAEALLSLAVARLAVVVLPFRVLARHLGTHMGESPRADDPAAEAPRRVAWAVAAASRRVPWRSMCLEQGLAAKAMLRRRGIPNTLYLGVARALDPADSVDAHAWVRAGTLHVTGGRDQSRYAVVSTFADAPE